MKQKKPNVTLSCLAQRLDLHVSTVSRILNGDNLEARRAASKATVERVRALAAALNYRPNPHATRLRTRKSRSVAVLVPRLSDVVLATIFEGINAAAIDHGYLSFVSNTGDSPQHQWDLGEMALDRGAEGLIVADARLDTTAFLDHVRKFDTPTILVSRRSADFCSITCDDVLGGKLAAEHLLKLGHRNFAVLAGEPYASTGHDRTKGFIQACQAHGITIPEHRILHGSFHTHAGREAGDFLLEQSDKPTAIFAVNDFIAIGVMGALRDRGLRPGHDIAVVGYNNTAISAQLPVGLTSVHSPRHEMGYRSLTMLLALINGEPQDSVRMPPHLVVRASSAP